MLLNLDKKRIIYVKLGESFGLLQSVKAQTYSNNTISKHTKNFITYRVTKARQPPLLELPGDETALGRRAPPLLPKQSRRIATQATAYIPTAKRGEYLVMKRLRLSSKMLPPSTSAMTYDEVFNGDPAHMQALRELFPPVGDVGVCKRRRRPTARV